MSNEKALTVGSLFAGIGGLELGLERAGMRVEWQVEKDAYCRRVLAKHWPTVERFDDVRHVGAHNLKRVDVICGGFPCQDISWAGFGAGLAGERSGLFYELARIIGELAPAYALLENVSALLVRGMGDVLGTLSDLGYDAEWSTVSACSVGASHVRQRVFIVAHANGQHGRPRVWYPAARLQWPVQAFDGFASARAGYSTRLANPSELYRGADGLPFGMDRNRAIGNAVHPGVSELIGRRLLEFHHTRTQAERAA